MRSIVLLVGAVDGAAAVPEFVRQAPDDVRVCVVLAGSAPIEGVDVIVVSASPLRPLRKVTAKRAPRHIVDVLLRRSNAAGFERAGARNPAALGALESADVIVALDADAVPLAWRAGRLNRSAAILNGLQAGLRALRVT
ncbi:hypothetical protein [Occultella gossypii]|uniref:Uncharacterized protein n=1 Tax=Occultella gossypii TaxID=2800820 RepID=A0ABS7S7W2_9MICO|nr:hypothetical protein [Occultella gossypii]MBZ2196446.1 hypothetical protein [Occultella gossypii]